MILSQRSFAALIALLSWLAIWIQFFISLHSATVDPTELLIRFFSYFTILTNLMVAVCSSSIALFPNKRIGIFFAKPATITGVNLYILVVGIVYNVTLRFLWQPEGIQWVVDELLHAIVPLLFLIYWFALDKRTVKWKFIFVWLIYPLCYLLYILWRGHFSGFYPYPFVDVVKLGLANVLTNIVAITFVFVLIASGLIAIRRWQAKRKD